MLLNKVLHARGCAGKEGLPLQDLKRTSGLRATCEGSTMWTEAQYNLLLVVTVDLEAGDQQGAVQQHAMRPVRSASRLTHPCNIWPHGESCQPLSYCYAHHCIADGPQLRWCVLCGPADRESSWVKQHMCPRCRNPEHRGSTPSDLLPGCILAGSDRTRAANCRPGRRDGRCHSPAGSCSHQYILCPTRLRCTSGAAFRRHKQLI